MNKLHLLGVGLLAAVGFTMSIFIAELAFEQAELVHEAKFGSLTASIVAGTIGYLLIKRACRTVPETQSQ